MWQRLCFLGMLGACTAVQSAPAQTKAADQDALREHVLAGLRIDCFLSLQAPDPALRDAIDDIWPLWKQADALWLSVMAALAEIDTPVGNNVADPARKMQRLARANTLRDLAHGTQVGLASDILRSLAESSGLSSQQAAAMQLKARCTPKRVYLFSAFAAQQHPGFAEHEDVSPIKLLFNTTWGDRDDRGAWAHAQGPFYARLQAASNLPQAFAGNLESNLVVGSWNADATTIAALSRHATANMSTADTNTKMSRNRLATHQPVLRSLGLGPLKRPELITADTGGDARAGFRPSSFRVLPVTALLQASATTVTPVQP